MKKLAILSDTHGLLRPEVLEQIEGCDMILHGGDINKQDILDQLNRIAPVYAVRGNNDREWAEHIPVSLHLNIEDLHFFIIHNKRQVPKDLTDVDVVIFGHSHRYTEQLIDGIFWLNPGSCGRRRFNQEITFALMTVDGKTYQTEK
ncbi:metallophosphoesterase family protein, partial [Butyricicoccus sp.]|uniref:metallophosphoesterase family protein n=1 Tax=Butyricicoccus sp. TaxID=2049021 RepID=UPI003F1351D6